MLEEGKFSDFYHKARKKVLKKKEEKKPEKAQDAGARARRVYKNFKKQFSK